MYVSAEATAMFDAAIERLATDLKSEIEESDHFYDIVEAKYKKAMTDPYAAITTMDNGELGLYISPADDTDSGFKVSFEQVLLKEIKDECISVKETKDRLATLITAIDDLGMTDSQFI